MCLYRDEKNSDPNFPFRIAMRYDTEYNKQRLYKYTGRSSDMMKWFNEKSDLYLERNIKDSPDDDEKIKWQKYMNIKINK